MRSRAERSLGTDLSGVRVHKGEKASHANRQMGSRAFAHGQDIVLGESESNGESSVMAHEIAHTVQQRGATPGIAQKSDRAPAGSAHELDADHAASKIMAGSPVKVSQAGAEQVMCFEGAEHMSLGNQAWAQNGVQQVTVGNVSLPPGAFTALQGDFFGTWDELERACNENPKLIYDYYAVLQKEGKLREAHQRDPANNPEPDSNGAILVASAANGRNPMDYLDLAAANFNHFSEQNDQGNALFDRAAKMNPAYSAEINDAKGKFGHNIGQWLSMHMSAAEKAFTDGMNGKEMAGGAVAMDSAACHYLTDSFAAGHMRVPRLEMYNEYQATFKAAARHKADAIVSALPEEIDLVAIGLATVGGSVGSWISDHLPGAVHPKISLAGVKSAIKAKLYSIMDSVGSTIAEKVAGFSAKVLHDYDNQHGVQVHNDAGKTWTAMGDHNLSASKENEEIAVKCTAASGVHIKNMHAAGKNQSSQKNKKAEMPFISLQSITNLLPQIDGKTKNEGMEPGGPRDWHWGTMSPAYRSQVKQNAIDAVKDAVSSAVGAIKDKVHDIVVQKVQQALAALGSIGQSIAGKIDQIVEKVLSYIPNIDPTMLIAGILA